jgi:hypothetical protein
LLLLEHRLDIGVSRNDPVTDRLVVEDRRFRAQPLVRREGIPQVEWIEMLPTHWAASVSRGSVRNGRLSEISFHHRANISRLGYEYDVSFIQQPVSICIIGWKSLSVTFKAVVMWILV